MAFRKVRVQGSMRRCAHAARQGDFEAEKRHGLLTAKRSYDLLA
jgi:hypothetical protein